ncbi:DUF805 domain-containing protein [Paracraurococcus lichenis]|uniref:DUF805 domain-containing protein n=1 Tax=Paracraurococcus lichenis TaxID=3064888 RepID=A0ABT9DUC3_9PROT|nr:DUF805 domain-containing protein [Paracraurococcus sp. LOR1-02]MDO9707400.1 DUF805 domain-containing protein [Paracraurococcus sp. LOR1-02]
MPFQDAVATCFRKYADFEGRARRSEYWWFFLFNLLMHAATGLVDAVVSGPEGIGLANGLFTLAVFLPNLAVAVRRLHDLDRSGWWLLFFLVPVVGVIVMIVWFVTPGRDGANRYGPDPVRAPRFATA